MGGTSLFWSRFRSKKRLVPIPIPVKKIGPGLGPAQKKLVAVPVGPEPGPLCPSLV
jgi:hypothetical protein